jgi:surface antigen
MFPRAYIKFVVAVPVAVLSVAAVASQASAQWVFPLIDAALTNPFGRDFEDLSEEDWAMVKTAMQTVLENGNAGAQSKWNNDKTERAGMAVLERAYQQDGRACGTVRHVFTEGDGKPYVLSMCKFEDGTWKIMP